MKQLKTIGKSLSRKELKSLTGGAQAYNLCPEAEVLYTCITYWGDGVTTTEYVCSNSAFRAAGRV